MACLCGKSSRGRMTEDYRSDRPSKLSHKFIKQITNDFDKALIVGSGGFGTVYKGTCKNGELIAVKVLNNIGFDNKEFQKEFDNLRRLKHQNVVKLVGFCNESEKMVTEYEGKLVTAEMMHTALCFEYVRNGCLDNHISADGCSSLSWYTQYKIIKGICEGLEYLRHGLELSVWHLDLKPGNILLDNNMIPKIADFGMSRLLGEEKTRNSINFVGTRGYMPPEYINRGHITKQFDIYSLGVIIAKLMAGREDYFKIDDMTEKGFVKHVHGNWRKRLRETLAPRQLEVYCEQVKICIELAVKCMNHERQERPTIQFIVSSLTETERMISNLGLQIEQFADGESILPDGDIAGDIPSTAPNWHSKLPGNSDTRPPETASHGSTGKTEDAKEYTLSVGVKELPLGLLKQITNDFSNEQILSKSVWGTLYKGILEDGEVIAVTKLGEDSPVPHHRSFIAEIEQIAALEHHENVVKLVGFCRETVKKVVINNGRYIVADIVQSLLCHEYLPNGSLEKNLLEVPINMDWATRFKIIEGTCQGLLFLHRNQVVHLDLKPGNIHLDNNMAPKIANFGLSRLFGQEQSRLRTQTVVGSFGYMPPEYIYRGELSTKSDIYCLGLLILETTTGERNVINHRECDSSRYIASVKNNWTSEHTASKYPSLDLQGLHEMKVCINLGLECVAIDARKRPSIENIVDTLNGHCRR